jgi:p-aminobenzoyl-glutamate transporter AbgT
MVGLRQSPLLRHLVWVIMCLMYCIKHINYGKSTKKIFKTKVQVVQECCMLQYILGKTAAAILQAESLNHQEDHQMLVCRTILERHCP